MQGKRYKVLGRVAFLVVAQDEVIYSVQYGSAGESVCSTTSGVVTYRIYDEI